MARDESFTSGPGVTWARLMQSAELGIRVDHWLAHDFGVEGCSTFRKASLAKSCNQVPMEKVMGKVKPMSCCNSAMGLQVWLLMCTAGWVNLHPATRKHSYDRPVDERILVPQMIVAKLENVGYQSMANWISQ